MATTGPGGTRRGRDPDEHDRRRPSGRPASRPGLVDGVAELCALHRPIAPGPQGLRYGDAAAPQPSPNPRGTGPRPRDVRSSEPSRQLPVGRRRYTRVNECYDCIRASSSERGPPPSPTSSARAGVLPGAGAPAADPHRCGGELGVRAPASEPAQGLRVVRPGDRRRRGEATPAKLSSWTIDRGGFASFADQHAACSRSDEVSGGRWSGRPGGAAGLRRRLERPSPRRLRGGGRRGCGRGPGGPADERSKGERDGPKDARSGIRGRRGSRGGERRSTGSRARG
jgi:hypothetical protein